MKTVEPQLRGQPDAGNIRYISPERAGTLIYQPNIDQSVSTSPTWLNDTRRRNQLSNFKEQSVALFRRLEYITVREIEMEHVKPGYVPRNFQEVVDKINTLLDRVRIERTPIEKSHTGFDLKDKESGNPVNPDDLSSGEAELVSLGIEFLAYEKECALGKRNFLLIDEPDVHLHPDLQDRLASFLLNELDHDHIKIILTTHSTSFLAALARKNTSHVCFMSKGDKVLEFEPVTEVQKRILPMYGAHPLSNVFNEAPILLLEGDDDERIWQQVVRSSKNRICLYPCSTDTVSKLNEYEAEANRFLSAIYDTAIGYSLRDQDDTTEEIADLEHVVRMKLSCRSAENLILTDEVLQLAGTTWPALQEQIVNFVSESKHHQYHPQMSSFLEQGLDRKKADLKDIRLVLAGLFTNKPWEVIVGQAIAALDSKSSTQSNTIRNFLGDKVCSNLLSL